MPLDSGVQRSEPRSDVRLTFPDGIVIAGPPGTTLETYCEAWKAEAHREQDVITAALVDDELCPLSHEPDRDARAQPLDLQSTDGMRVYKRSLVLVIVAAARRLFPNARVNVDHSITANGFYCTLSGRAPLTEEEVRCLEQEARALVAADRPITVTTMPLAEALALFREVGYAQTVRLLSTHSCSTVQVHQLDGTPAVFFDLLVPHTGGLRRFHLDHEEDGFLVLLPLAEDPDRYPEDTHFPKLTHEFRTASRWLREIGAGDAGSLNLAIESHHFRELVLVAEALHERRIATIAQAITQRPAVRIVFISGPSSSGKTTFSKRLGIQLAADGIQTFAVAMDDYFIDRDHTPVAEDGSLDFEAFDAVDHELFQQDVLALLEGKRVRMPRYDFHTGSRVAGPEVELPNNAVLIVEGLHGLNPRLLPKAPREALYRVYVSCLTQLRLDHHSYVSTSDARLLRRLVRDARSRGYTAEATILRWQSVRRGERTYVFPYQEWADSFFNSALPYETAVIKPLAEPLLMPYDHNSPASVEVKRLLGILRLFRPAEAEAVPDNSIFREFIGGSILEHIHLAGRPG